MADSLRLSFVLRRLASAGAVFALGVSSTGCDGVFDAFRDETTLVHVFSTHNGTPQGGVFPDYGDQGTRTWTTDLGWTVTLSDAFVVTSAVALRNCGGDVQGVDFYYGQLPEDLTGPDLESESLGSTEAPATTYCMLQATFSSYMAIDSADIGDHQPSSDVIVGHSLYLRGLAEKNGQSIPFEVHSEREVSVLLDISTLDDGNPFKLTGKETYPAELLISKVYDHFFDGVDFTALADIDLEEQVWAVIETDTHVSIGTIPYGV